MRRVTVDTWIGNAAAVLSGYWGAVTRRAEQTGYSRTSIDNHTHRVVQAVANEQRRGVSYDQLWMDHERLRTENEALWQAWAACDQVDEEIQHEFAATASAMGLSLTQIMVLLAIGLPGGAVPSHATIGRWVQQACAKVSRLLMVLDRVCQPYVQRLCLDEIFFHREPVLVAVAPYSMV